MRIFLYEFTCCSALSQQPAAALSDEGRAMLGALLEDFRGIGGAHVVTMQTAARAFPRPAPGVRVVDAGDEETTFRELAGSAEFTLVIAPELDEILSTRCRWVVDSGGCLLGPTCSAVRLTGDKWALCNHFRQHEIPTPDSLLFDAGRAIPQCRYPAVWKPRHGAGSWATYLIRGPEEWLPCRLQREKEVFHGESLVQPFVPGLAASISFLIGRADCIPLVPAEQQLSADGRFHYRGGRLPLPHDLAARAIRLAQRAVATVPELRGYVGVDVILGDAADGSGDLVMEINPRVTTSYIGLRALTGGNLAELILQLVQGKKPAEIRWKNAVVHFQADGTVTLLAR